MTLHATRDGDSITVHVTYGSVTVKVEEHYGHAVSFWHQLGALLADDREERAKGGYTRYVEDCGGVSVNGDYLPPWEGLPEKIQRHWIAAFTE